MNSKKLWKILIVDDDSKWVDKYEEWLNNLIKELGWKEWFYPDVIKAYNGEEAFNLIKEDMDINVVISDIFMEPNCSRGSGGPDLPEEPFGGIWLAKEIWDYKNEVDRDISCLLISDKSEADKYLRKWIPEEWYSDEFVYFVEKYSDIKERKEELFNKTYLAFVKIAKVGRMMTGVPFSNIITVNSKMRDLFPQIETISDTDFGVLLLGESGTGKELFARAIHNSSPRKSEQFIAINCSAIPDNLLESELFGHEQGAFTDAIKRKEGKFEIADGGTILLDEIGDLPLTLQSKILRVLQEHEIQMVGGKQPIKVDVRVIAATHKNLEEMIKKEKFREDLYHRINVVPIYLPALRERKNDIPLLINYFLDKYNKKTSRSVKISDTTIEQMCNYNWRRNNVRELENLIMRTVANKNEQEIVKEIAKSQSQEVENLQSEVEIPDEGIDANEKVKIFEKKLAENALKRSNGDRTKAQQLLKVSDSTFRRWLKGES